MEKFSDPRPEQREMNSAMASDRFVPQRPAGFHLWSLERSQWLLPAAILLLIIVGVFSFEFQQKSNNLSEAVSANRRVTTHLSSLIIALVDAETGQRGYLLTKQESYLEPFHSGVKQTTTELAALLLATDSNPAQHARADAIRSLSQKKLAELNLTIRLFRDAGVDAALKIVDTGDGKRFMDDIRRICLEMQTAANTSMLSNSQATARYQSIAFSLVAVGSVGFGLLLLLAIIAIRSANQQRDRHLQVAREQALVLDLANDTVFIRDLDDRIIYWNKGAERLYGWDSKSAFGQVAHDLLKTVFPQPPEEIRAQLLAQGFWKGELQHARMDGSSVLVGSNWTLRKGESGQPASVLEINHDITARREAEHQLDDSQKILLQRDIQLETVNQDLVASSAALVVSDDAHHKSEAEFGQLADSMPQIVWTADANGKVDYYNERWYIFTGFDRGLFGDESWMPLLHPEDASKRFDAWYASVRSGLPFKDEHRFWDRASKTYRWHLGRALPLKDEKGAIVKWFGACTDIDDYKQAQAQLSVLNADLEARVAGRTQELTHANDELVRTKTWLQAMLDSATEVSIIALDNFGIITFFNSGSERLLGYRAEELVGKCTPYMLYPPEQCELRARQFSAELRRPVSADEIFLSVNLPSKSFVFESVYLHRDGSAIDISVAVSPMIDSSGTRLGRLLIAGDMRARQTLERQLTANNERLQEQTRCAEEANQAKSDFLSAMSHEIRTPMNAILGMADLLWESDLESFQRRYVEVFRRAGANLLTLVNDILDLSKIESGQFELEQIDFDLNEVFDQTLQMIRPKTNAKGITLTASIQPGLPCALMGDPTRLQQIISNLLGNAVKFTEAGEIRFAVAADTANPHRLLFEVSDSGIGIPASRLEDIFNDFTQAESSTTRRFGGTGLGLGICRRLVNRMGGELDVRSEAGKGSCFTFDAIFSPSSQAKLPRPELTSGLSGRRVLIIDDIYTNRLIFAEMCRVWGMKAVECDGASTALSALETAIQNGETMDLIIVDRFMRETDGLELVSQIRKICPQVPFLMITSDNVPGDQTRALQLGITEYAVKPVRRPELLRLIVKILGAADRTKAERLAATNNALHQPDFKIRLLIAEDSEDNRFLMEEYLKRGPYEIRFVENGQLAVEAAGSGSYDLILMDMQMPVMDGLTATRLIREAEQKEQRQAVPLVALTANARQEDVQLSRAAGCNAHVSKPISKRELVRSIDEYARRAGPVSTPSSLTINIPAGLEEGAKRYIKSRKSEIPRLFALVTQQNFEQVRILAHNMKGTGTSYGFPDLTRLGRLMEASAKNQNGSELGQQLPELEKYVNAAEECVMGSK